MSRSDTLSSSRSASAQACPAVSRVITCSRMPKRMSGFKDRIQSSFCATAAGGSPQVRYTSACSAATGPAAADDPPK